jgi:hypothetical protein
MIKEVAKDIKKLLADVGMELNYNFYFGTRTEIDNLLIAKGLTEAQRLYKYPFVWLVSNYSETLSDNYDFYSTVDFVLVFANVTKIQSNSENRKSTNIDTVLRPMVSQFMATLQKTKHYQYISRKAGEAINYQLFERPLYGFDANKHVFSDNATDAIELKIRLKLAIKTCKV